jgi:2-aminoadipate transaminase
MDYSFSRSFQALQPSALRESFKLAADPTVISFAAGSPSPDTFPATEMLEILNDVLTDPLRTAKALQYGVSEGVSELRMLLLERMKNRFHTGRNGDTILITSGGQQGIELCAKIFLDCGDVVFTETPTFSNSLNTFRAFGPKLIGIPIQPDGMDIEVLEAALKREPKRKIIYCISSFQNPTGFTTSPEKRRALYELACKYNVIIIEDDPYIELRYSGEHVMPIKSYDEEGRVVYVNSLSKVISPGIRLGFTILNNEIAKKMVVAKQGEDVHANVPMQIVAAEYINKYDFNTHISMIRQTYCKKRDLMLSCLDTNFPIDVAHSSPDGGFFIWCTLPEGIDSGKLADLAFQRKLLISLGHGFMVQTNAVCTNFRLSFSLPSEQKIIQGIDILGDAVNQLLGR